jgi:hypothetical protein
MMQSRLHLRSISWRENLQLWWHVLVQHRVAAGVVSAIVIALIGAALYLQHLRKPSPEEVERRRRLRLVQVGRIVDGAILETGGEYGESVVMFTYRVAGVQYTGAQDLSAVPNTTGNFRVDLPVQVRYDPRNPFNSIVAAETWSGLRLT